jgi:ATP-binding cassette subfamily F protein 3
VILISHDRHMVELTADRLVLVDGGTAQEYAGSMEDYIDFILGRNQPKAEGKGEAKPKAGKGDKRANAQAREDYRAMQKRIREAETRISKVQAQIAAIDLAMAEPAKAAKDLASLNMGELSRRRAALADDLRRPRRPGWN